MSRQSRDALPELVAVAVAASRFQSPSLVHWSNGALARRDSEAAGAGRWGGGPSPTRNFAAVNTPLSCDVTANPMRKLASDGVSNEPISRQFPSIGRNQPLAC